MNKKVRMLMKKNNQPMAYACKYLERKMVTSSEVNRYVPLHNKLDANSRLRFMQRF
jgi:hypothetical protein